MGFYIVSKKGKCLYCNNTISLGASFCNIVCKKRYSKEKQKCVFCGNYFIDKVKKAFCSPLCRKEYIETMQATHYKR